MVLPFANVGGKGYVVEIGSVIVQLVDRSSVTERGGGGYTKFGIKGELRYNKYVEGRCYVCW